MKCLRCHNTDPTFFYKDHGSWYCRKCISFSRLDAGLHLQKHVYRSRKVSVRPKMKFAYTKAQKQIVQQILDGLRQKKDLFVYAATGAGKTEITYEAICMYLAEGKKVGFAISRRQVVLEITDRLRQAFPVLSVVPVTKGYTDVIDGDIIVCTMHQLYRYPSTFDLLIYDEVDAFPFAGNEVLKQISLQACKGQRLYLSATPDEENFKEIEKGSMKMVCLFERPHQHPLIVPQVSKGSWIAQIVWILFYCRQWVKDKKQILVFVPRKKDAERIAHLLTLLVRVKPIHSDTLDKDEIMEQFHHKELDVLVCTTLLERGITVPSVQVLVYHADHSVFTTASLIQIFGRVGRSFQDPEGRGICLCQTASDSIRGCIRQLQWMNRSARSAASR